MTHPDRPAAARLALVADSPAAIQRPPRAVPRSPRAVRRARNRVSSWLTRATRDAQRIGASHAELQALMQLAEAMAKRLTQ